MTVFDAVFKYTDICVSFLTDAGDDEIFLGDKTDTGQFVVSEFVESGNGVNNLYKLGEMEKLLKEIGFLSIKVYSSFNKEFAIDNKSETLLYECVL